ncbi:flagellar hook-basal body protein [Bartonella melophagi K-2C]|uniref:Flagellar hook-basal body protein n=1 Tax=Bartonella melophagi K-2C TaxID=1094557 RepID=J0ZJV7_9HYPH|nr:flagellar hook-basal body complex protein [Bartonella melophagi]EJF88603.1 flagellar hook-basal body protein [Bartonella melophagi K-2C]
MQPVITIPVGSKNITVSPDGIVYYQTDMDPNPVEAGRLNWVNFVNTVGLEVIGDNLFRKTPASGAPVPRFPKDEGYGSIMQAMLESSNVDPVKEITATLTAETKINSTVDLIRIQPELVKTLAGNIDSNIRALVDINMDAESARLSALQIQKQLNAQIFPIANQNTYHTLALSQK